MMRILIGWVYRIAGARGVVVCSVVYALCRVFRFAVRYRFLRAKGWLRRRVRYGWSVAPADCEEVLALKARMHPHAARYGVRVAGVRNASPWGPRPRDGFAFWRRQGVLLPIGGAAASPPNPPVGALGPGYWEDAMLILGRLRSRVVDVLDHQMVGDGVADDGGPLAAALLDANPGDTLLITRTPRVTAPFVIDKAVHVLGYGAKLIDDWATEGHVIHIPADGVRINGLEVAGKAPVDWAASISGAAINVDRGVKDTRLFDLDLHTKKLGVRGATTPSLTPGVDGLRVQRSKIHNVVGGVGLGGDGNIETQFHNDVRVYDNEITSEQGSTIQSRGVNGTNIRNIWIRDNRIIGAGMTCELFQSTAYVAAADAAASFEWNQTVQGNVTDSMISGGTRVIDNELDGRLIPPGRGIHAQGFNAIEPGPPFSRIEGNVIQHMPIDIAGIGPVLHPGLQILANTFRNMNENQFASIYFSARYSSSFQYWSHRREWIIEHNLFEDVRRPLVEVANSFSGLRGRALYFRHNIVRGTTAGTTLRHFDDLHIEDNLFENMQRNSTDPQGYAFLVHEGDNVVVRRNRWRTLGGATGFGYAFGAGATVTGLVFEDNDSHGHLNSLAYDLPYANQMTVRGNRRNGLVFLGGETDWNISGLANDAVAATSMAMTGARAGDVVRVSHTAAGSNNVLLSGHVSNDNNVRVMLHNKTGAPLTINGQVRVSLEKVRTA